MNEILFLIIILILNALAIIGFHYAVQYQEVKSKIGLVIPEETKNILWWVRFYGNITLPIKLRKPLYDCMRCMPSLHGLYIYVPAILLFGLPLWVLAFYPIYVLILSGIMVLIESKFNI